MRFPTSMWQKAKKKRRGGLRRPGSSPLWGGPAREPVLPLARSPSGVGYFLAGSAAAGAAWDVLPLGRRERGLLLLTAALWSVALFLARDGAYLLGPDGIYYPCVLWLELAFAGRPLWQWALPVSALAGLGGFAFRQLGRLAQA